VFGLSFRLGLGLLCPLEEKSEKDTLRPLSSVFLPEVTMKLTRKATGHFVRLIKVDTPLIECPAGHNHFTS